MKRLKQLDQHIIRLETKKYRLMKRESRQSPSFRKARTRTLIQLGGLIEKSGLLSNFDIALGDDLQLDPHIKEDVETLLGLLVDANQSMMNDPELRHMAQLKGKKSWDGIN